MSYIKDANGKPDTDEPDFDKRIRVLYPAHVSDTDPVSSVFEMAKAEQGLPGGHQIDSPEELFKRFNIRVTAQASRFHPPKSYGDSGAGVPVKVDLRASRADDFTGAEIRVRKVSAANHEVNELEILNCLINRVFDVLQRDLTASESSANAQSARKKIGEILVQMGARLSLDRMPS